MNIKEFIYDRVSGWNSIKRKHLLTHLRFNGADISDRKLRKIVAEMVEEGYPIGTSPERGYFICKSQDDFNEATKSLHSKAMALLYRERKLKEGIEKHTGKQIELPGLI